MEEVQPMVVVPFSLLNTRSLRLQDLVGHRESLQPLGILSFLLWSFGYSSVGKHAVYSSVT